MKPFKVSFIIPAFNAEQTIADTLRSLIAQTFSGWEAVIVDDGSSDSTADIVKKIIEHDHRFQMISQNNQGQNMARNTGLKYVRNDWIVFLDSDDWVLPRYLECFSNLLCSHPELDGAYCGWTYYTPDGFYIFDSFEGKTSDLFAEHAGYCFSIVHTYVVRRSIITELGGFDLTLCTCADWDLWQRISRTGARFGSVAETLAIYRIREGSASRDGYQLLQDGLRVIDRGHSPDARVANPHQSHISGQPKRYLSMRKFQFFCACAGYVIGNGKDARTLFNIMENEKCSYLNAYFVALQIFIHTLISSAQPMNRWITVWKDLNDKIINFLIGLEKSSGTPNLARRVQPILGYLCCKYFEKQNYSSDFKVSKAGLMLRFHKVSSTFISIRQFMKKLFQESFNAGLINSYSK